MLTDPTPPPSSHNPKLPRAFDHIVGKALAKDPAERYQDADEMARDLRRYDRVDLDTPAPAPLPALEHPTNPKAVPATDVVRSAARAGLAAAAEGPWWKRKVGVEHCRCRPSWSSRSRRSWCRARATAPTVPAPMRRHERNASRRPAHLLQRRPALHRLRPPSTGGCELAARPTGATTAPQPLSPPRTSDRGTRAVGRIRAVGSDRGHAAALPVAPKPTGRVVLAVQPWGEIYVDGKKRGISPPTKELRLAAGPARRRDPQRHFPPHSETVQVNADEVVRITHSF